MQVIFMDLLRYQKPSAVVILKYLLRYGLPVDDFIDDLIEDEQAPLHLAVANDRIDFVS